MERLPRESPLRIAAVAGVVAASYYAGAHLGFILRLPPTTPSILWLPNAILTAALLLTPKHRWWIWILAAFPAHVVVELEAAFPPLLALALFATNCSEALLAAVGVRAFSDAPHRLDTLRRMLVFVLMAGIAAPFLSSFLDAGAVALIQGEDYWLVWRTRFFSNVLAQLALVPAIVTVATGFRRWLRDADLRARVEAAALGLALVGVAVAVFGGSLHASAPTPLAFLLPLLMVAAVRFGPAGAGLSLLTVTLVAVWAGTYREGPFASLPQAEAVLALQVYLSVVAIPIYGLASLIEERRRAQRAVGERLQFQKTLSRLTAAFVHLPGNEIEAVIQEWLRPIAESLHLERLALRDPEGGVRHVWERGPGRGASRVAHMVAGGRTLGSLAATTALDGRSVPEELDERLQLVAEVLANALARQEAERALRASERMSTAILASLSNAVAVLDRDGRIVAVNATWNRLELEAAKMGDLVMATGVNYLDAARLATRPGLHAVPEALAEIEAVLRGEHAGYASEYSVPAQDGQRWFALSVVPLDRPEGGAVVSRTEVTDRKRAELEAQRSRVELAHYNRVSTMGELTASLAHELRQPLSGILTNAQVALRLLQGESPDLKELRLTMKDIIQDERRAAAVIQRLRDLLSKREPRRTQLDLNVVVRGVAGLLGSDAVMRRVHVSLELAAEPIVVSGDRIQLEQVVLNLMLNGMEAMADCADRERVLVVTTDRQDSRARMAVVDAGTGLPDGAAERVFEPFFSTKPAGMGMGLSIARSIAQSHGGTLHATHNASHGTTFHLVLPCG